MFKTMTSALNPRANPSLEEINKIPSYIMCRWLSGNSVTVQAANAINLYSDIPIENQFNMIKSAFAGRVKFIPYPKNNSEQELKSVEYLSRHFNISLEKAKEYLTLIDDDELNSIIEMYEEYDLKHK